MINYAKNNGVRYYGIDKINKLIYLWKGEFSIPDDFPFYLGNASWSEWGFHIRGRGVYLSGIKREFFRWN